MSALTSSASELADSGSVVWLAGAGRSGTTWLGKIFDASPAVLYRHEPDNLAKLPFFEGLPSRIEPEDGEPEYRRRFEEGLAASASRHALHFFRPPEFEKEFTRPRLLGAVNALLRLGRAAGVTPHFGARPWLFRSEPAHVAVKSVVSNMRLGWLRRNFPGVRVVLIVRHPGGYLSSWKEGAAKHGWRGFGAVERLSPTVLPFPFPDHEKYREAFERGSDFERELIYWIVANETPIRQLEGDAGTHVVVYEDLCADPVGVTRELFGFAGIEMTPSVEGFVDASTQRSTDGFHSVFKDPMDSAMKWKRTLDDDEQATVRRYLQESRLAGLWRDAEA